MNTEDAYRHIGHVLKPKGIQGEFFVFLESDFPKWLAQRRAFYVQTTAGFEPWQVTKSRLEKGRLVLKVDALKDRSAVENARETPLYVPEAEAREVLDEDYFFNSDLVGLAVYDLKNNVQLGQVKNVIEMPVQNLLEVERASGATFLIPFIRELVPEVDQESGRMGVNLPEGLIDLNEKQAKQ